MRLQQLKHLEAAMEAFAAYVDVDTLLAALLADIRHLFHMDAAFVWLAAEGDLFRLQLADGASASVVSRLQRVKMSASGVRNVARRLRQLGYHTVLPAPLRTHAGIVGLVAAGSRRPHRSGRIDAAMFRLLVQSVARALERLPSLPLQESMDAHRPVAARPSPEVQNERMRFLNMFISGIAHDLNNAITTISGRVELLLNRVHDQVTLQHLGAANGASNEVAQMVRHIHNLVSGSHEDRMVMVDINQLVRDCVQIARSTWFQGFRHTRVPVELGVELSPVPALLGRSLDLRIVLLCLLRHAMDTVRPEGVVMVRTRCEGEEGLETLLVSISDDPGQFSAAGEDQGFGLLLSHLHSPDSRRALEFVQAIIRDLGVRITVQRGAGGGTITTLIFNLRGPVAREP
ncbi:MAG TPA: GAF domain-containing protein [Candidatus Tectomicrobia bacterium]|nr:GAF domain-containing protein [Candidatus Tectomicrobia bacterium]